MGAEARLPLHDDLVGGVLLHEAVPIRAHRFASVTLAAPGEATEDGRLAVAGYDRDGADRGAHAPAADHLAGDLGELLDVRLGAGAGLAVDDLLRGTAAERDSDLRPHLGLAIVEAVGLGRREGDAERKT